MIRIRGISLPLLLFFRSGEDLPEREALESLLPLLDLPLLSEFCSDLDLDLERGRDLDLDLDLDGEDVILFLKCNVQNCLLLLN